jgi:tetratricopeptide (TPR) repeat protein
MCDYLDVGYVTPSSFRPASTDNKASPVRLTDALPSPQLVDELLNQARRATSANAEEARELARDAHTLAFMLKYRRGVARALIRLAWLDAQASDLDNAILKASEARVIAHSFGDWALHADAAYVTCSVYRRAGLFDEAESLWRELITDARKHHDLAREADYLTALALAKGDKGDLRASLSLRMQAHDIYARLADSNYVLSLNNLARAHAELYELDRAQLLADLALVQCDPQVTHWLAHIHYTLGLIAYRRNDPNTALRHLDAALQTQNDPAGKPTELTIDAQRARAWSHRALGATDHAAEILETLLRDVSAAGLSTKIARIHRDLYETCKLANNLSSALRHHEIAAALEATA